MVDSTSDKEHIPCCQITVSKLLDIHLIIEQHLHLCRNGLQIFQHSCKACLVKHPFYVGKLHCQKIERDQLCGVRLGCGNRNLRSGPGIHDIVCFSCNGTSNHIYDPKNPCALFLRLAQGCQRIRSLPGLADHDNQRIFIQNRIPVTEFRSHIYLHRNPRQSFEYIFTGISGMGGRAAGHDLNLLDLQNLLIRHPKFLDHDLPLLDPWGKCICDGFWLLIHFL